MPMPPGMPADASGLSSLASVIAQSVVRIMMAMEAAFCNADRVTFAGSTMPAASMSTMSPVMAFQPLLPLACLTRSTMMPPYTPAFSAI